MTKPLLVCAGVVFLAGGSYLLYYFMRGPAEDRGYGYLYCNKCGFETIAAADQKNRKVICPKCGPWPQEMIYSKWSKAEYGGSDSLAVPITCLAALGGLGLLYAYLTLVRPALKGRSNAAAVHVLRCPDCQRKFQYTTSQKGRSFNCSRCHRRIVIPTHT
jgi:DNA-directed RNA polymerase subunit RPC12/RpoP